jgi:exonuclease III
MTTVLEELEKLAHDHDPDFIVITETKLRNKGLGRQRLAAALPGCRLHTSCKEDASSTRQGERTGAAGVAIAVHRRLTRHASVSYAMLSSPAAAGHCQLIY